MTAAPVKHRTRKNSRMLWIWNVQTQTTAGVWASIGMVRNLGALGWEATAGGVRLGEFPTRRAAIDAVLGAQS